MKNNRRMSKEDRQAQIIDAAMSLFVKNGYNATTTASIAEKAEISEVTLFRNFSSKEELFLAGLEPILITSLENSIIETEKMEAHDKLKYILKDRIKFASTNHEVLKLILMESQINPEVVGSDYIQKVLSLLEESIKASGIEFQNEELTLRLMLGSVLSFLYFPETDDEKIEEYVNNLVSTIQGQNN